MISLTYPAFLPTPSHRKLQEGDLINNDVLADMNGLWSDNGSSFVLGTNVHQHQKRINASEEILRKAISNIQGGIRIADIGHLIESQAKQRGYKVIKISVVTASVAPCTNYLRIF